MREHYLSYLDVFHERRLEKLSRFYAEDVILHPTPPQPGLKGLTAVLEPWIVAFPDLRLTLHELIYTDGLVAVRLTISGTHSGGPFMGIAPASRAISYGDQCFYRFQDGKFTEVWDLPDSLALLQQLGARLSLPGT